MALGLGLLHYSQFENATAWQIATPDFRDELRIFNGSALPEEARAWKKDRCSQIMLTVFPELGTEQDTVADAYGELFGLLYRKAEERVDCAPLSELLTQVVAKRILKPRGLTEEQDANVLFLAEFANPLRTDAILEELDATASLLDQVRLTAIASLESHLQRTVASEKRLVKRSHAAEGHISRLGKVTPHLHTFGVLLSLVPGIPKIAGVSLLAIAFFLKIPKIALAAEQVERKHRVKVLNEEKDSLVAHLKILKKE